jgi:hypothetical protein
MAVPAYELMFGKLSLHNLFEDYFDQAGNMTSRIMLKPLEDPHVDLIATVSCQTFTLFTRWFLRLISRLVLFCRERKTLYHG